MRRNPQVQTQHRANRGVIKMVARRAAFDKFEEAKFLAAQRHDVPRSVNGSGPPNRPQRLLARCQSFRSSSFGSILPSTSNGRCPRTLLNITL